MKENANKVGSVSKARMLCPKDLSSNPTTNNSLW